jgi:hypothetical protein
VFAATDVLDQANLRPPQVVQLSDALGLSPVALTSEALVEQLSTAASRRSATPRGGNP